MKFTRVSIAKLAALALTSALALGATTAAQANDDIFWSIAMSSPGVRVGVSNAPAAPVVVHERHVYAPPPPVYAPHPRVVVLPPHPVYRVHPGYYGHRVHAERHARWEDRRERWHERHDRYDRHERREHFGDRHGRDDGPRGRGYGHGGPEAHMGRR